jgi:hypothetical protein
MLFRLLDNPQDAIRVRANDHAVAINKGGAAPVWSCEDGDIFRNNLAGHGHTREASTRAWFNWPPIRPRRPQGTVRLHRRSA